MSNEQTALTVFENRLTASVALIQALGGGWDSSQLPAAPMDDAAAKVSDAADPAPASPAKSDDSGIGGWLHTMSDRIAAVFSGPAP